jgi:hypothetical protein
MHCLFLPRATWPRPYAAEVQGLLEARLLRCGKQFEQALLDVDNCLAIMQHATAKVLSGMQATARRHHCLRCRRLCTVCCGELHSATQGSQSDACMQDPQACHVWP